jgi:small subunit ribosomal protein S4
MRRSRKKYKRPLKPWDKERLDLERETLKKFGLRRKREMWTAQTLLRKFRSTARNLAAKKDKESEKMLIKKMIGLGLLDESASSLDDILSMTRENVLERRLQTVLFRKGLSNTANQARQFITHGLVTINSRRIIYPSYLVSKDEEGKIQVRATPKAVKVKAAPEKQVAVNEG